MRWMCSFPEPFILLCDCLAWIIPCILFLIHNHEILTFIPPKAIFLEHIILQAMKPLLSLGQGLETFPSLCDLLAMRYRAQLLSDGAHCFICHCQCPHQRVLYIVPLQKFQVTPWPSWQGEFQVPSPITKKEFPLVSDPWCHSCSWPVGHRDNCEQDY